jgi:protein gp37
MGDLSKIEWLHNPFTGVQGASLNDKWGCTKISPACENCYITRTPPLRMRHLQFDRAGVGGQTGIVMAAAKVQLYPLTQWRNKHLMIFVNSLSELWHAETSIDHIAKMYAVMLLASQHVFLTLTKRARRMRLWLTDPRFAAKVAAAILEIARDGQAQVTDEQVQLALDCVPAGRAIRLPAHIWTGTTVEDNQRRHRIDELWDIDTEGPRWLSCEPLTSEDEDPLNLTGHLVSPDGGCRIGWAVFGGESGPAAKATPLDIEQGADPPPGLRPITRANLERLLGQVRTVGAAPFVKQLGEPWARTHGYTDRNARDMSEWPDVLRVREYPLALARHTLTYQPGNQLALAAVAAG